MRQTLLTRLLVTVFALSLTAVACSSSTETTATGSDPEGGTTATSTGEADPGGEPEPESTGEDPPTTSTIDPDQPVDPEAIRDLTSRLTGLSIEGEQLTCMVENTDGDSQLTQLFNGYQNPGFQFTPEAFTALAVNAHDCVDPILLSGTFVSMAGGEGDAGQFTSCMAARLSDEQTGDLVYTGLAALQVQFQVPEGAQEVTIETVSECVSPESLAGQLAAARENATGFTEEVDRDCLLEGLTDEFIEMFWRGSITGNTEGGTLEPLLEGCTSAYDSGLPKEIPGDFEPFSGAGTLAGIDPQVRVNAYSEPPPMSLEAGVDYQAVFTTEDGEILIDLYEEAAPITVNSFVALARDGYYNGTNFHRVLDGFMAQGGDPSNTGGGGPGYTFDDEQSGLTPVDSRGLLAMANSGANTNGGQFFITLEAAEHLNGLHTVFGAVIDGDDVLGQIDLRDPQAPTGRGERLISVEIIEG